MGNLLAFLKEHHFGVLILAAGGAAWAAYLGNYGAAAGALGTGVAYCFPGSPALAALFSAIGGKAK